MCKSIYKLIQNDFDYLKEYGYNFKYISRHNIIPDVVFEKNKSILRIGMDYEHRQMVVYWFKDKDTLEAENVLENFKTPWVTYEQQVDKVKTILNEFLKSKME